MSATLQKWAEFWRSNTIKATFQDGDAAIKLGLISMAIQWQILNSFVYPQTAHA